MLCSIIGHKWQDLLHIYLMNFAIYIHRFQAWAATWGPEWASIINYGHCFSFRLLLSLSLHTQLLLKQSSCRSYQREVECFGIAIGSYLGNTCQVVTPHAKSQWLTFPLAVIWERHHITWWSLMYRASGWPYHWQLSGRHIISCGDASCIGTVADLSIDSYLGDIVSRGGASCIDQWMTFPLEVIWETHHIWWWRLV